MELQNAGFTGTISLENGTVLVFQNGLYCGGKVSNKPVNLPPDTIRPVNDPNGLTGIFAFDSKTSLRFDKGRIIGVETSK